MRGRPLLSSLVAVLAIGSSLEPALAQSSPSELKVYHLDIEQGDATLVVSPDGHALLFDGGNHGMGTNRILPRLRALGITSLDYTVASHYDADHVAGLSEVISGGYRPIVAYDRGGSQKTTDTYAEYVAAAGAQRRTILPGEMFMLGADVLVECVVVNGVTADGQRIPVGDDDNASSIALVVRYRGFEEFIAGDLTAGGLGTVDVESRLGPRVRDLDVYRVCHHGSDTGTSPAFLARTLPEIALISCGTANRYGHPNQATLDKLTQAASVGAIWCTNRGSEATSPKLRVASTTFGNDGEITITTTGSGTYSINGVVYPLVVDTAAPTLTGPTADTSRPGATITWTTNEPAEAVIEYGLSPSYGLSTRRMTLAINHAIGLPGLDSVTTYHYRVGAIDSTGNASWSQGMTFTTSADATWRGLVLNEIASPGSGGSEWVEIRNGSSGPVDMTGWTLTDNEAHTFTFPSFVLPVRTRVLVTSASSGTDDVDASDGIATFYAGRTGRFGTTYVWNDAGDDVHLRDAAGNTVDWVAYGTGTAISAPPGGEWSGPYPAKPLSGQSVSRYPDGGTDTATSADWALRPASRGFSNGIPPVPPTALAGPSIAIREGDTATLDGTASSAAAGATIVSYQWSFGDGATGTGARPTHTYADDGEFQAVLTVTDSNGQKAVAGTSVQVSNTPPVVTLNTTFAATQGVEVTLAGSATDGAADTPTLGYSWDFGDGSTASGPSVAHVYTASGTFTATLAVTDKNGGQGVATAQVTVTRPSSPYISSVSPNTGSQGGGTLVSITGYRLEGATVTFGGVRATVVSVSTAATPTSSQTLQCLTPPGVGLGIVDVRVNTAGGQYTRSRVFTFADPAATISGLDPASAPTGSATTVTIRGTGFFQAGSTLPTIVVGNRPVSTISSVTPTGIVCVFPDDLSGFKDVVVTNPDGKSVTLAGGFERRSGPRLELAAPTRVVAGYPIDSSVTVRVTDPSGATITTATNTITIGLNANPAGATLSGPLTATAVNGVATFPGLTLDRAGSGVTLRAVSGLLSGESAAFAVQGGPARLVFMNQPRTVEIGASSIPRQPPLTVEVQNASGQRVEGVSLSVTLSISGGASLSGTTTLATTTGTATFTDLSVAQAGMGYVLTARASGLSATSNPFDVLAGPAKRLVFQTSPGNGTSGAPLQAAPVVVAKDLAGNAIAVNATITLSVPRTAPQGPLFGTWAVPANGPSATFSDLRIMAAGGYTLIASAPGFASATSKPFSIAPGPPARLGFRGQPTLSEPDRPIWPPIRVVVQDAAGNDVAAVASDVTISLYSNPGGALLSGTTTAPVVNGVSVFPDLVLDRDGWEYDLVASAQGLASARSAPFDIERSLFRFKAATPAVTEARVGSVAIRDLDGDGLGDVVTTLTEENAISIRRSLGAGRFGPDLRISVGRSPQGVTIADLNDDGWPDIAVANEGSYDVAVVYGTGGGALAPAQFVPVGRPVTLLVAGDVDSDGRVDLTATSGDSEILVLYQTSVGTLTLPQAVPATAGRVQHFALADVDRDGALDLVVAQRSPSGVLITYGDGRGGFSGTTSLAAENEPFWIGVSDLTRDGFPEIVFLRDDPVETEFCSQLVTYPNRRNRTFGAAIKSATTHQATGVTLDDVTGDGIPDALVSYNANLYRGVAFYSGKATGGFAAPVLTVTRAIPTSVSAGDVNGDGLPDLALTVSLAQGLSYPPARAVDVALAVGDGTFALAQEHSLGDRDPQHLAAGDVTGDGKLDVLATARGGGLTYLIGLPGDTFRGRYFNAGTTLTHPPSASLLFDFNGDGRADQVTIAQNPGEVLIWRATGSTSLQGYKTVHGIAGQPEAIACGDLNGDGRQDLVVADLTGNVWVLFGKTGTSFDPPRSFPAGAGARSLALADVTGDGRLDAVVATSSGVQLLVGAGAAGFSSPSQIVAQTGLGLVCAGELNGDGLSDLVVISPATNGSTAGTAQILYATGQGLFQAGASVALGASPNAAALRDIDRDGVADLVVTNGAENDVSIFPGRRGQAFAPVRRFPTGLNSYGLVVADLNGDGCLDIVTSNCSGHPSATVLFGR